LLTISSLASQANKNLQKAARIFNLTLVEHGGEEGTMAIWDGSRFVYAESKGWGWGYFDLAKMFWRFVPLTSRVGSLPEDVLSQVRSIAAQGPLSRQGYRR
jgi:prenylcysteine oxidase/farnesylcysteine lyase